MAATATPTPGVIEPEKLYRLDALRVASGLGEWAIRQARRGGLRVRYIGGRGFVKGADFLAFVESVGDAEHPNAR